MLRNSHLANLPVGNALQYQPASLMNFNYNNTFLPIERGSLAVRSRNDFFRDLWGVPKDLAKMMESNSNMQPLDIIAQYKDRALEIPSNQLTAMIWNGQASWLSETAAPIFPTTEFNFTSQFREMNMIEYTRTAVGGIPNEQTFRTTSWKDTIEKVQLNARLEMDFSLDSNFGEDAWIFQLKGLAANAMLTIHKTIAYSIIHIAYTNLVGENLKSNPYDLSKILAKEEEYFAVVAFDQVKYLRMINRMSDVILDFDTVIIPFNSVAYISELLGESTSMQAQKVVTDPVTGGLQWEFALGKKSVGTVTYGERQIHFIEMPMFRVNMVQDMAKEQPLRTSVTIAQAYPCDPTIKSSDTPVISKDNLDLYLFFQTKNQGDEAKISIKDAYAASWYWDEESTYGDGLSAYAHDFCRHKNQTIMNDSNMIPWDFNEANPKRHRDNDINREYDYDYDTPNMEYINNKEKLLDMRGWRDQFFGLTYIPEERTFRLPKRIADFELAAMPNRWLHKSTKAIAHVANSLAGSNMDFDAMMDETFDLLDDIANAEWTDEYIVALINANIDKMYNHNDLDENGLPKFTPARRPNVKKGEAELFPNSTKLDEWRGNRFGSLNLPKKTSGITQVYPPGFDSGPGLVTLAKEADNDQSLWREAGLRAKRVVTFWDIFARLIREYIGPSDVIDPCLTPPWFHVKSEIAVLIDSFRHYRAPVFLAVPDATISSSSNIQNYTKSKDYMNEATVTDINYFTGNSVYLSGNPLSNIVKFAVILDTYTSNVEGYVPSNEGGLKQVNRIGSLLIQALTSGNNRTSHLYSVILTKLIDYTVELIYNRTTKSTTTKQLNIVTYIAHKLRDASTDDALKIVLTQLELFINSNTDKKTGNAALKLYDESIDRDPLLKAYKEANTTTTTDAIQLMKSEEDRIKTNISARRARLTESTNQYTYDELVAAMNDVNNNTRIENQVIDGNAVQVRVPNDNLSPVERNRVERSMDIVNSNVAGRFQQSTSKPTIHMNLSNPEIGVYLRAPLMGGDRLFEYLQRTPNPLIKPSDPYVFHESMLEIINEDTMNHPSFHAHKKEDHVPCSFMPFSHTFRMGLSTSYNSRGNNNSDLFGDIISKKSTSGTKSSKSMDIGHFIQQSRTSSLGARTYDDMDEEGLGRFEESRRKQRRGLFEEEYLELRDKKKYSQANRQTRQQYLEAEAKFEKFLSREEYFGPHLGRYNYMNKHITSPFEKAIFKAIMLAPNRITIHCKLANIGQKLVNVIIFRLFIQHIMSSTIVMKAGKDVLRTAIGPGKVWLNTEQRGFNIINSGFYLGTVRVRPDAIQMMPFTHPEDFVGGMGVEFMKNASHFRYKTTDKESMIAVITPISETTYQYPIHILNLPTYNRRDTNNAPHLRKWSSSEFISFIIKENTLYEVQGIIESAKKNYGHAFDISLCAHRGCVKYRDVNDPRMGFKVIPGTGPRGHPRMNVRGADETFSGKRVKFPDLQSDLLLRQ